MSIRLAVQSDSSMLVASSPALGQSKQTEVVTGEAMPVHGS